MTIEKIDELFASVIASKDFKSRSGFTKHQVYNYRNRPQSLGTKLELLYKLEDILVTEKDYGN